MTGQGSGRSARLIAGLIVVAVISTIIVATIQRSQGSQPSLTTAELTPAIEQLDPPDRASLPGLLTDKDSEMDPASIRSLGTSSFGEHWIALSERGSICIATELASPKPSEPSVHSSACADSEQFNHEGVGVSSSGPRNTQVITYLLPPDVDVSPLASFKGQGAHIDIVARDPQPVIAMDLETARRAEKTPLTREDGEPFKLATIATH